MALIDVRAARKTYRSGNEDVEVLTDVTFRVERGEHVAVVGASGSGKSTLMHLLGLLDTPSGGAYRLLGEDVTRLDDAARAERRNRVIGFVFQAFYLLPRLTLEENVALPLQYAATPPRAKRERAREVLAAVGLEGLSNRLPPQVSGGQRQRAAIARALVNDPALILADEPTGNLDSRTAEGVLDLFAGLHAGGRTLVVVTHDAAVARRATRVLTVRDGRVVSDAPPDPGFA